MIHFENKKKLIRNVAFALLGGLFIALIGGAYFQRHALACDLLPYRGYKEINDNIFLAPDVLNNRADELTKIIDSANQRITNVYGNRIAKPWILITSSTETTKKWGSNETGAMHRMPWCSCIIIGPQGQNVDVIAHELLHAEIQERVGLWRLLKEIPVWFDEGAALTLDYREPFLPDNIQLSEEDITEVMTLDSHKKFFSGRIRDNYQAARLAVIPLIKRETFYDDLDRIKKGESFHSVFTTTETLK